MIESVKAGSGLPVSCRIQAALRDPTMRAQHTGKSENSISTRKPLNFMHETGIPLPVLSLAH
jgi:hypothetical protein